MYDIIEEYGRNIWSNYSDLTQPQRKWWFSKGNSLISVKPRLVKYDSIWPETSKVQPLQPFQTAFCILFLQAARPCMSSIDLIKHQVGYDFRWFFLFPCHKTPVFHGQTPGALIVFFGAITVRVIIYIHILSICKYLMNYHQFNPVHTNHFPQFSWLDEFGDLPTAGQAVGLIHPNGRYGSRTLQSVLRSRVWMLPVAGWTNLLARWFQNPKQPPFGWLKTLERMGYSSSLVYPWWCRILFINSMLVSCRNLTCQVSVGY